ncbi:MAG: hypothetical protein BIFFINMI_00551 [Phycisphaerae bacterium]|nr:hypothetical protein [Phycisphaerae bacterium]
MTVSQPPSPWDDGANPGNLPPPGFSGSAAALPLDGVYTVKQAGVAATGGSQRETAAGKSAVLMATGRCNVTQRIGVCLVAWLALAAVRPLLGQEPVAQLDEFKVKREPVYAFASKPVVTRSGDRVTIAFESQGLCDVTVAIEDASGRIVRHLASGVLGPNAPEPLAKDSKKQSIVWDGKNDQGRYVDRIDAMTVRVSLGLRAQFERTLFWSPKKRIAPGNRPQFAAAPEGVYVHEAGGIDHLRLFDHKGNYVRTVYPFPGDYSSDAAKAGGPDSMQAVLSGVKGLQWFRSPIDGLMIPEWQGIFFQTLLTSGSNAGVGTGRTGPTKYGSAATAMAWSPGPGGQGPGRLALTMRRLNRLATDGTTGGLPLEGPQTAESGRPDREGNPTWIYPSASVFSPDGKWLYLLLGNAVTRMEYAGDKPPEPFIGEPLKPGKDATHFTSPSSLAMDSAGRLYVADYINDRIQVFTPDGKLYKSVAFQKPLRVFVSPKNGDIYVGSWLALLPHVPDIRLKATFTHLGPVDDPKAIMSCPLPFASYSEGVFMNRTWNTHELFMDFHADPPTLWIVPGSGDSDSQLMQQRRDYSKGQWQFSGWAACHYRLAIEKGGKLYEVDNFAKDVATKVGRIDPPSTPAHERQRLYVNPTTGKLYVMEGDSGVGKSTRSLLEVDPDTNATREIPLPFTTEEIAFDLYGMLYLRTDVAVGRYQLKDLREVPFDYGEELEHPGFDGDGRTVNSFIRLPTTGKPGQFHLGGFAVSPRGNIVVSCYNIPEHHSRTEAGPALPAAVGRQYAPPIYPGRARYGEVHIWDEHGNVVREDVVPGLSITDGLAIDRDDNIYALWAARRLLPGQNASSNTPQREGYLPISSETLVKFKPGQAKILSTSKTVVNLPKDMFPDRKPDVREAVGGLAWAQGAEWMYGGVGCDGFIPHWAPNCSCWNARPTLDLYARSFVTELARSRVAVLDTNGNLIMRIGRYGNVDDGRPLVLADGPADPHPVGGDEVALAKPSYVATWTDHRLFIADYGNYRILSVKLDYHAQEKVGLKDVADQAKKTP